VKYIRVLYCVVFVLLLYSCGTTRKVPEGNYLIKKNTIKVIYPTDIPSNRRLPTDELLMYVSQKTNRNDMFRFHLGLYNLSGKDSTKWINRKLQSWGEAPEIFDSVTIPYSVSNLKSHLRNMGYYHATIDDSVVYKKKKAEVIYTISTNESYTVNIIEYNIFDTAIKNLILTDTLRLAQGRRMSANMLDRERERITSKLRNNGYYTFNKSFITFEADTINNNMLVNLVMSIPAYKKMDENNNVIETNYPVYKINDVHVYTNYNSHIAVADSTYINSFEKISNNHLHVLYKDNANLKQGVISRVNLFATGDIYSENKSAQTYNNFSNLALFKSITIQFKEVGENLLDCVIFLDPFDNQSYKVDFELSTNSSDMIGFSPGLNYRHKNLFGGAEIFNVDFRGVFQYSFRANGETSQEYNVRATLNVPRFMMPISIDYFKNHIPHTEFSASYVYQQRPDYTRAMANFRFGYIWKTSQKRTYLFNPFDFYMIRMYDLTPEFYNRITNLYLKNTYSNHLIFGMSGSYINDPRTELSLLSRRRRRDSYLYHRINGDIAGNVLSAFNTTMKTDSTGMRLIGGIPYSQYIKGDINVIYNKPVATRSSIVYRGYFGIGKAYGNSPSLPFEKMFYSGGASSLRGWQIRSIGPGTVPADSVAVFPNQVGDLKLEVNVEYRFPLFWKLEGAVFADAGNIWSISPSDTREEAKFKFNKFYKEIALNTGLGLRVDFSLFLIRFDIGNKVYNPGRPENNRFISPNKWLKRDNFSLHFGIDYPF